MLRAANEQVVGKRVLEKMCTQLSEAGGSGRQAKGKKGLGWALKDGWTLERSQETEGSCRLKIHALAIHPPPVISQSTITVLRFRQERREEPGWSLGWEWVMPPVRTLGSHPLSHLGLLSWLLLSQCADTKKCDDTKKSSNLIFSLKFY